LASSRCHASSDDGGAIARCRHACSRAPMACSARCKRCLSPHCGDGSGRALTPWGSFPTPWELFPTVWGIPSPRCGASVWGACFDHGHHGHRMRMDGWALSPDRTGIRSTCCWGTRTSPFCPSRASHASGGALWLRSGYAGHFLRNHELT
jgi:hypothetical protein